MHTKPSPDDPPIPILDVNKHSVLVLKELGSENTLFKMQVEPDGRFRQPPAVAPDDDAAKRLVFSLAGAVMPDGASTTQAGHVSYGILPIKPDPTSAHFSCHLINSSVLYPRNAWTIGPWSVPPVPDGTRVPRLNTIVLLATTEGKIIRVNPNETIEEVDPRENPGVWRLLRNGCVVGMVELAGENDLVPLINLAAFGPARDASTSNDGNADSIKLTGTWDFKWPKGSLIRIRIDGPNVTGPTALGWQDGKPAELTTQQKSAAVDRVKDLVRLWLEKTGNPGEFQIEFRATNSNDYDILINLDPLAGVGDIKAPQSDLGTYAQRRKLGEPTSYCGHPEGLKDKDGERIERYYDSPAFTHIVLHELGHIWGLPHLHQHPGWGGPIVRATENEELGATILRVMGLNVDEATLNTDLRDRWPGDPVKYGDWPDLDGQPPGHYAGESIMMGHPIRGVLEGDPETTPRLDYRTEPGSMDVAWLADLYSFAPPAPPEG